VPNRAFTAYRRFPCSAIVVGTLNWAVVGSWAFVILVTTVPVRRFDESLIFATVFSWFCTTYSVLPSSRIPSPFGTLSGAPPGPVSAIARAMRSRRW
jgi:hypothetical protein